MKPLSPIATSEGPSSYAGLNAERIIETVDQLEHRISDRFPQSGLSKVCAQLLDVSRHTAERVREVRRPAYLLRGLIFAVIAAGLAGQVYAFNVLGLGALWHQTDVVSLAQGLESAVNLLLLAGAATWFLLGMEQRLKRGRVYGYLHELRSIAHIVDMHQLTKDPTVVLHTGQATPSSPKRNMTEFELARYLDYCAEMLALIEKLAALYADRTGDPDIVRAVNDIEDLTGNLGRKIWQKIMIISELDERRVLDRISAQSGPSQPGS